MTKKMNPKIKAKWVAALRSGKYQQAKSQLKSGDAFCCLGVLCDLQDAGGWGGAHEETAGLPSDAVLDWAALDYKASVKIGREFATLYQHNDCGANFAQIADAIESQL